MIPSKQTLITNEEAIQEEIKKRKIELFYLLSDSISEETNDYFYDFDISSEPTEEDLEMIYSKSLINLCKETNKIQSPIRNNPIIPSAPKAISPKTLYAREKYLKNQIQYGNNLLRRALIRSGIEFPADCNIMEELIKKVATIPSRKEYAGYISDVNLNSNGDLKVTYIQFEDLHSSNVVDSLSFESDDLFVSTDSSGENLYVDLRLKSDGDLRYKRESDE